MPQQNVPGIENNFTKGLVTEFTGLNFPANAATDCDNATFTLVGDVTRRGGFEFEENGTGQGFDRTGLAINSYKWNNVGGDGETQIVVIQVGGELHFYLASNATTANPLSTTWMTGQTQGFAGLVASGGTFDATLECQFADGNGYLFVYHPNCDPFYITYSAGTISLTPITLQVRDFTGVQEPGVPVNARPNILTAEHSYNLSNQGWISANAWSASSTTLVGPSVGSIPFQVASGITGISNGQLVKIYYTGAPFTGTGSIADGLQMTGTVTGYSGTTLTINVNSFGYTTPCSGTGAGWFIVPYNIAYLNTWFTAIGNYPSNADVWWYFKDNTDVFNPTSTINNITLATGNAPQGHFILNPFQQSRSGLSGQAVTDIKTTARPRTGAWFQGRVWYAGVDAQQIATGDASYYTWTENIYFSQIVQTATDFGNCYQTNDPTSETLFDLLPTDGGVIQIQGCGSIYKLFPIQNGMLVFAANGVWFITGSQGIGFSANDYTITKISSVQSISGSSFVDVQGLPYFWNEEGIYAVEPQQGGGLAVNPLTVGTILTFYNTIPLSSKKTAKAAYHPIDYIIQWLYKDTVATDTTDVYTYNRILNFNTYNKAFYPYSLDISDADHFPTINGIIYVAGPGGTNSPEPVFKYITSIPNPPVYYNTFAEENDFTNYVDWKHDGGIDYESYFITGYRLAGQGQRRFQIPYIYTFSRGGEESKFHIQGIWDYASSGNSGRFSAKQLVTNNNTNFGMIFKRHRLRGQGLVLQIKVSSVPGQPFDLMGWATFETSNTGV